MTSYEIRQQFFDFFKNKEHRYVQSAPVVPYNDPTLLFTNAGMNQFKDVFLGEGTREYSRAVDTQKCIRVSGKHNDLEEVGKDTYHHTFFEMLGNWSFGDYYKKEAIRWAWELLTEVWKLPKERMWATVYTTDDEAFEYWKSETDIKHDHILRFGEKDNFWEMGDTGPCGPCSEIHINLSDDYDNPKYVNADVPECIEIWNLVFIQYNRDEEGTLHNLSAKHVDTGMGFERIVAVLQNKNSNYDTDIFTLLINKISELSKIKYEGDNQIPMRVISDHIRALTFAIGDGAIPGNEGRSYVLRRILRRAARYGRKINLKDPFMYKLVDVLVYQMKEVFPEIEEKQKNIEEIIKAEEEGFNATLDRGIELFEQISERVIKEGKKTISGDDVFKLYDTFGFPVDLTNIMADEKNLKIDEERFKALMEKQRERARKSTKEKMASVNVAAGKFEDLDFGKLEKTEFTGYDELKTDDAEVVGVKNESNQSYVILDKTPFYPESGGQIDDKGKLVIEDNAFEVKELAKVNDQIIHIVDKPEKVYLEKGMRLSAQVDEKRRWHIMRNHSATHFLHAALRTVLGNHVQQSGSYVGPDRLRFDFTHFKKLSEEETAQIETLVNEKLRENLPRRQHRNVPFDEAKEMGALMFFGDKYGDYVNVIQFGDYTIEFCGGTHVQNSSQIGLFKIVSEASIASGVRRIEAVTGAGVEEFIKQQNQKLQKEHNRLEELLEEKKKLEKEIQGLQLKEKLGGIDEIIKHPNEVKGVKIYKGKVDASGMDELKSMGDDLRNKIKHGVGLLATEINAKVMMAVVVNDDLIKEKNLLAGKLVGDTAKIVGGGGGGRSHLATAGGKDTSKIDEALEKFDEIVEAYL